MCLLRENPDAWYMQEEMLVEEVGAERRGLHVVGDVEGGLISPWASCMGDE